MYTIILFCGGVYRFDELVEFVEDVGGIILKEDHFQIIRGDYFLAEEIRVILILPKNEIKSLKLIAKDIKGRIEDIKIEDSQKRAMQSYIPVYNILCIIGDWVSKENFVNVIECPCSASICPELDKIICIDELEKILDDMCVLEIAEYRMYNGKKEYRIKCD
jgi:hypothetical protein